MYAVTLKINSSVILMCACPYMCTVYICLVLEKM